MAKAAVKQVSPPPASPPPAPAEEAEEAPVKKKRPSKKLLLAGAALIAIIGGGAAGWYFLAGQSAGDAQQEAKPHSSKPPVFVNLENFTVNLQPEDGEKYLQVMAVLKVEDSRASESVKTYMPEIRHRMLSLLASKRASEISSPQGREALSEEMRAVANRVIGVASGTLSKRAEAPKGAGDKAAGQGVPARTTVQGPIQSVFFTSFIIQ
jgi:flagellar FliL protein